jgi:hypothetical protein
LDGKNHCPATVLAGAYASTAAAASELQPLDALKAAVLAEPVPTAVPIAFATVVFASHQESPLVSPAPHVFGAIS